MKCRIAFTVDVSLCGAVSAFCKGMRSKTSIYPVFEVILRKTLEQPCGRTEHLGRTAESLREVNDTISKALWDYGIGLIK